MSSPYTHRKRVYHAHCIQYTPDTKAKVVTLLESHGVEVSPYDDCLMLRWFDGRPDCIKTLDTGMWVRVGENGSVKLMSDEEFQLKYEAIA